MRRLVLSCALLLHASVVSSQGQIHQAIDSFGPDEAAAGEELSGRGRLLQEGCESRVAQAIKDAVPEVSTLNPERCCSFDGPTAVYVTHAQSDPSEPTGFEPFWNDIYIQLAETSETFDVCFVMTGVNQNEPTERTLTAILIEVNNFVSRLSDVPSMMSTDPTDANELVNLFRLINNDPNRASNGVFNAGYDNIQREAAVTGQPLLPFVGYTDDALYGVEAADITLRLLQGDAPAKPLCFNGRPDLSFVGRRCAAYYRAVTDDPPESLGGIACRDDSPVEAILALIVQQNANAVYSHVDCCGQVAQAVVLAREMNMTIVGGCQDVGSEGMQFVTGQPIQLQADQTASWANLPVIETLDGQDGREEQYFPSGQSLVNTEIFNTLTVF